MIIPVFVQKLLQRAYYDLDYQHPKSEPGYTIWIEKRTVYAQAATLRAECERLVKWAKKNGADAEILKCPERTHFYAQRALVTISDPVMVKLEPFISESEDAAFHR